MQMVTSAFFISPFPFSVLLLSPTKKIIMFSLKTFSVFVVDDDPMMRAMLKDFISRKFSNAQISLHNTGEAMLTAMSQKPDLIILDYQLDSVEPGAMNGLQVMKHLKENHSEIPGIFLSSQENPDIAANTIKYGAFDYIAKNTHAFERLEIIMNNALHRNELKKGLGAQKFFNAVLLVLFVALAAGMIYYRFIAK